MTQAESRTYVTTTTNRWAVAFLNDAATVGYDAKIESLKLLLEQKPPSKSKINTQLQKNHDINKRQANSIIAYVEGAVKSAIECRSNHIKLLQGKLKHTTEVIEKLEKKINAHSKYLQAVEQVNRGKKKKVSKSLKPKYPDACPMRCAHHLTLYQFAKVKLHQKKRYAHKLRQKIAQIKTSPVHVNLGNKYTVDGNLDGFSQIKVNIQSQPKGRTEAILVDVVTDLTELALEHKRPIIVEKLDFTDKRKRLRELNARARRMLSNFAYSKFLQLLLARCFKLGIQVIEVNPAYSSWIGLIKFMSTYGMNSATAAAFVLARRGMFLSERLPARTAYQGMEPKKHTWSHWQSVAKRAKGSSRHSFYQPRLTVYSRLRSVRNGGSWDEPSSAAVNPFGELREVGENPTGSR
ncbi:IS200/IS605 family accessory protein TnpB-related protein [Coleofasciculus chthonoplastes]|uniref:IS200/IS605 family accessory protein TnpB-related protein n=1 Tax=Coleofasciculus chthonoplastes TaxID=64178 RepID=UPI0032FA853F